MTTRRSITIRKSYNIRSIFAISLYQATVVGLSTNNVVVSPLGVRASLSLTYLGAEGQTETEIQKYLYLPHSKEQVANKLRAMTDPSRSDKTYVVCNNIWISKSIQIGEGFVEMVKSANRDPPMSIDFTKGAAAVSQLNRYMAAQTNGKIQNIIKSEDIRDAKIVLMSGIYLKALFAKPFDIGATEKGAFWVNRNTKVDVDMMHITERFKYCDLPIINAKAIEIPFKEEKTVMLIILPDSRGNVKEVEYHLRKIEFFGLSEEMAEKEVQLTLPRFSVEFQMNSMNIIPKIGIKEMFTSAANFRGITDEKIFVTHTYHTAFVNISEAGGEGAIANFDQIYNWNKNFDQIKFTVDRPFLFVIKDDRRVHFIGRIVKV